MERCLYYNNFNSRWWQWMLYMFYENKKRKHLFLLRIWQESLGQQEKEWRGEIKHLGNGEVRYFRDVPTLYAALKNMLGSSEQPETVDWNSLPSKEDSEL